MDRLTTEFLSELSNKLIALNRKVNRLTSPILKQRILKTEIAGSSFLANEEKEYTISFDSAALGDFCRVSMAYQQFFSVSCEIRLDAQVTVIIKNNDSSGQTLTTTDVIIFLDKVPSYL